MRILTAALVSLTLGTLALAAPAGDRSAYLYTHPAAQTPLTAGYNQVTAFNPDAGSTVTFDGSSQPHALKLPGKLAWNPRLTPQGVLAAQLDFAKCRVVLWDLSTQKAISTLQGDFKETFGCGRDGTEFVFNSAFTADGKFFLAADHRGASRWDVQTGKRLNVRTGGWYGLDVSPDGKTVALLSEGRRIELWASDFSRRLKALPAQPANCLNFMGARPNWSPDSRLLAFSCNGEVRVWNVQAGGLRGYQRVQQNEYTEAPVFSPDSRFLVADEDGAGVEVWDVATGKRIASTGLVAGTQVTDTVVTKQNLMLAALDDGRLLRLDLEQPASVLRPVQVFERPQKGVTLWPRLAVNPEGTWFAMSDGRGRVTVVPLPLPDDWDTERQ